MEDEETGGGGGRFGGRVDILLTSEPLKVRERPRW